MNIPITSKDSESVIKILPKKKAPGPNCHKPEKAKGDVTVKCNVGSWDRKGALGKRYRNLNKLWSLISKKKKK